MRISDTLKAKRLTMGLSELELARAAGITLDSYWDIENHDEEILVSVSFEEASKICNKLELDLIDLLCVCNPLLPLLMESNCEKEIVGSWFLERRLALGWSVEELSEFLEFDLEFVKDLDTTPSKWVSLSISDLIRLCLCLKTPLSHLKLQGTT